MGPLLEVTRSTSAPRALSGRARRWVAAAISALCALTVAGWSGPAVANGAFPDSLQLLLPADRPEQIGLATNFGLILSDDGGASWTWTCERKETLEGTLYAVGAPPDDRFYGLANAAVAYSDDASCSWKVAANDVGSVLVRDFFPDPVDARRVLAIGEPLTGPASTSAPRVFVSRDGGTSFSDAIFTAPDGATLTGVESARSDPRTIYVAMSTGTTSQLGLARTTDGGQTWTALDLGAQLGKGVARIIAVDPQDARVIFLRVIQASGESLAMSRDGGATFTRPVQIPGGVLKAFARLADGTQLAAGAVGATAVGFRSTDAGTTFGPWTGVPHLAALAERDGVLYAAASDYYDKWAVGVSTDGGATFQPLARYGQVRAVRACAQAACLGMCEDQVKRQLWATAVCSVAGVSAPVTAAPAIPVAVQSPGGCALAPSPAPGASGTLVFGLLCLAGRRRRGRAVRSRRARRSTAARCDTNRPAWGRRAPGS